ncbi:MAG: VWA domain-containing protein [Terracidiphilus sp.]
MIRIWAGIFLSLAMALPAIAAERISVAQLEGILAKAQGQSDNDLAAQLSSFQLTERFTSARAARWRASFPGASSQRALMGLADRSAFLDPPASENPATPAPDLAEQRRIMGLAANYVSHSIPQLPRFYATRTVTHFQDHPGTVTDASPEESDSLHAVRVSRATVLYQNGQEVVEAAPVKVQNHRNADQGLRTWGAFGPILGLVLVDAAQNKLSWAHWEQGSGGPLAVFSYAVPKDRSHYEVRYCCVAESYGLESHMFQQMSAYHGTIAVDPANGMIARLTIEAEMAPTDPISRAATAVEYGPVELGGMTYICPVRSVSLSVAKTLRNVQDPSGHSWVAMGPRQMLLNHVDFEQYHLFLAESHVLSREEERAAGVTPDATLPQAQAADMSPAEEDLADASPANPASATASPADESAEAVPAPAGEGEAPEISTAAATGLPDAPAHPAEQAPGAQASGVTLRLNARLVDVNVVALDKKGHPITNLKPTDFEVYDNGVKQDVRSFAQTDTDAAESMPAPQTAPAAAPPEFSNRSEKDSKTASAEGNTVILLVDGSNLSFPDLADARQQMVHFLRTLPASERVALYTMKYHGYQVLQEASTDHDAIAARLAKWMPTVQDLANAQDEEKRNRQQVETVHSPEDLLSVNGNFVLDTGAQSEALDPNLRELGSMPGPNALNILVDVAHHLSAMQGHKSLVWITSDNALADWNRLSLNLDKGSKFIEPIALRTQEAMNNAHVSVYPLDASRLEASVINADIGRRNVELTPTFQRSPTQESQMQGPEASAGPTLNTYDENHDYGTQSRLYASMQQDMHPISGIFREVADATGGRTFRRSSNIIGELNDVVSDGHATYLLGFSPTQPADGKYHMLTVKLIGHRDASLRFRSGYQYDREPTTLKERFAQTVWQPTDASEIKVSTKLVTDASGSALRVTVAGSDLDLAQQNAIWAGKLDIFLVQRDQEAVRAKVTGLTVGLRLKPVTYQRAMKEGLTFDERLDAKQAGGSLRVIVIDINSGRIGSVTVPTAALVAQR